MIVPLVLFLGVGTLGGLFVLLLTLGSWFSPSLQVRKRRALKTLRQLESGLADRILNEPFLFDSTTRCKVAGRLMNISSGLAGAVYKYFNLIVFGSLVLACLLIFEGFNLLKT